MGQTLGYLVGRSSGEMEALARLGIAWDRGSLSLSKLAGVASKFGVEGSIMVDQRDFPPP